MVAREKSKSMLEQVEDIFSDLKIISYQIDKQGVTLSICEKCIEEATTEYDLLVWGGAIAGTLLLIIQFYTGVLWYLLAPGGILLLVSIKYRSEYGRHWKDIADRIVVKVVEKIMAREMMKDPSIKILTRDEYSKMIGGW